MGYATEKSKLFSGSHNIIAGLTHGSSIFDCASPLRGNIQQITVPLYVLEYTRVFTMEYGTFPKGGV